MLTEHAGSDDTDAQLKEPAVRVELRKPLGAEMNHLVRSRIVKASVDLIGDMLVGGHAPLQAPKKNRSSRSMPRECLITRIPVPFQDPTVLS